MKKNSIEYVDFVERVEVQEIPFNAIVNGMGNGSYPYYDPVDLLVEGKITKIV